MHQVEAMCNRIVLINQGRSVLYGEVDRIKESFSGNAIILQGDGNIEKIPGILETKKQNGTYHLVLDKDTQPQDIFRYLAHQENMNVERFEIAKPSLDDIFISVVQEGNTKRGLNG
jgi:ABC-2 type transport system ATP-binding protein